jgi:hypothetical protein
MTDSSAFFNLPAAHKMNNLEPVSRLYGRRNPLRSRQNLEISLNGHAIRGQAQVQEKLLYAKPSGNLFRFTIDDNLNP